jgi:hypothetical protein
MARVHHAGNPIVNKDEEELDLLDGEMAVETIFKDVVEVQVVTKLIKIVD